MLIYVKYTRDRQLGLKKNLQDSQVKPTIFTTQTRSFLLRFYLITVSKSEILCSHLLNKFFNGEVHWFVQVNRKKTIVKKKITHFLKNYVAYSDFSKKSLQFPNFLQLSVLDTRFWELLFFIYLKFNQYYWFHLLCREKMCWSSSHF